MDEPLQFLIAQATALAGGNTCAAGHEWEFDSAARACPHGAHTCSQDVYRCQRCGELDYGEPGGPGWEDCQGGCTAEAREIITMKEGQAA